MRLSACVRVYVCDPLCACAVLPGAVACGVLWSVVCGEEDLLYRAG